MRLTDTPYQPNSRHLDHIVPLNIGGTHTIGNVRIICLACNLSRPKDGSDITGQLALWALTGSPHHQAATAGVTAVTH